ncbi:PREDICTED: uncharacterized protein LOC109228251 isoform X2 [Nicotiana attenuata]|uniref:uncharacterized protein LOC109228251 isoform X2 n=1 Tax=Nicotiana attenuata TaxID=49451 RepID=UPI000904E47A|nr:PREDICTED: uncharacterized protein LOC109228251 isoform X2 [Nicotiana attenuata]
MPFYRILRMGCGVSKIDANGVATPNRILPNFPNRRRHKECTPSKKEPLLLMHEIPDEDHANNRHSISAPKCDDNMSCVTSEGSNEKRVAKIMAIVQAEEKNNEGGGVHENEENGGEKDDNNDDDLRAINKVRVDEEDGDVYPGSPSFRVYFTDTDVESNNNDGNNKVGLKDITPVAATTISSTKEYCVVKEEKKEIRKKSFRNVLPRNLLNVRSSSNSSTRSTHHHNTHHPA